jgi:hypothetical protein
MKNQLTTLSELLTKPDQLDPRQFVYLPMGEPWSLSTRCALLECSDINGNPEFAEKHGLEYAIGADAVQGVAYNLKSQVPVPTEKQLLEAFLFYYDNDAFVSVEN